MEVEETEIEFEVFDGTRPEAEEIKVTGPSNLEIVFSEPIEEGGDVEVKSGNSTIGTGDYEGYGSRTISITVWDELKDGETYEVIVKDFKDYAELINISKTFEVEYVKDTEPPVAEITKVEQTHIKVEFSKPVTGLHKENFYHTFTAWEAKGIYKDEAMTDTYEIGPEDSVKTVWVKFADDADNDRPLAEGTQRVGIRGKYDDVDVVDNWGNKFEGVEIDVTVTVDKENPEVTSITVESEEELKVTFNKVVKFSEDNIEVLDTDGKEIDDVNLTVSPSGDAKEFKVTLGTKLPGKTIVVKITDVEDTALHPNKLSEYKATIEITDKTAPKVTVSYKVELKDGEFVKGYLYFFFNEDVTSTATDKNNYARMDGNQLKSFDKSPRFFDGRAVVELEINKEEYEAIIKNNKNDLFVQKIEDNAGNAMAGTVIKNDEESLKDIEEDAPEVEKVEATAKDKLVVTFDQRLVAGNNVPKGIFEVEVDNKSVDNKSISVSLNDEGNTVVTLIIDGTIKADATGVTLAIENEQGNYLKNIFGVAAPSYNNEKGVDDKIAPSIVEENKKLKITATNETNEEGNKVGVIKITFDENIKNSTTARDFEVSGYTVKSVKVVDGNVVTIRLTEKIKETAKTVKLTQKYAVEDEKGNEFKLDKQVTVNFVKGDGGGGSEG